MISKEKKRSTDKVKAFQQKIQVMSTQKVDIANKLMQFAELNLDQIIKDKAMSGASTGVKAKRESK